MGIFDVAGVSILRAALTDQSTLYAEQSTKHKASMGTQMYLCTVFDVMLLFHFNPLLHCGCLAWHRVFEYADTFFLYVGISPVGFTHSHVFPSNPFSYQNN